MNYVHSFLSIETVFCIFLLFCFSSYWGCGFWQYHVYGWHFHSQVIWLADVASAYYIFIFIIVYVIYCLRHMNVFLFVVVLMGSAKKKLFFSVCLLDCTNFHFFCLLPVCMFPAFISSALLSHKMNRIMMTMTKTTIIVTEVSVNITIGTLELNFVCCRGCIWIVRLIGSQTLMSFAYLLQKASSRTELPSLLPWPISSWRKVNI